MSAKKTPLYEKHLALGGNVVDYAGWMLPVEYDTLKVEHDAVRERVGLFDVSHMGEVTVKGKDALAFVNKVFTNDYTKIEDGQIGYTLMCHEDGGIVDDLLVYRVNAEDFLLVPNASNTDKDFAHLSKYAKDFDVELVNISDTVGQIAIQGPKAQEVLQELVDIDLDEIKYYRFKQNVKYKGYDVLVSRTGYTGEDGFEVYGNEECIVKLWDDILEVGKKFDIKPCGLGCRDTLRFEASLPLYGNEMADDINPVESGLKFFVKLDKEDFVGKAALEKVVAEGAKRKIVGFEMEGKRIPRHGYEVQKDGKTIGVVTTGYLSPTLNKCIANILVDADAVQLGDEVDVMIRNKPAKGKVISKKYLKK